MSFFASNLERLRVTQPELAARLENLIVPENRYQILPTKVEQPTMQVEIEGKRPHLLGSRYDPWTEAFRWTEAFKDNEHYNLCFIGGGMWYHVLALMHETQQTLSDVIVIDFDPAIARLALEHVDLTQVLGNPHLSWFVEPSIEAIREKIRENNTQFALDGLTIIEHDPTVALSPEKYDEIKKVIVDDQRSGEMLLRTKATMGALIQENILLNLPNLFTEPGASILTGQFEDVPAFIVGAGPSLDKNIEDLKAVDGRGLIVAVDTAYPILLRRGIKADVNVTCDPSLYNLKHFEGVSDVGDGVMAYSPSIRPEILEGVGGAKVSIPLPTSRTILRLKDALGLPAYMKPGIMVVQAAFNLAKLWGCEPIVFVGTDLSFAPKGGPTHATGSALLRNITSSPTAGKMRVKLLDGQDEDFTPLMIPGNETSEVPTSQFWYSYLRSLQGDIKNFYGRVINATAGGAKIEGAEYRRLDETIQEICKDSVNPSERIKKALAYFIPPEISILEEFFAEAEVLLENAIRACDEGEGHIKKLEEELIDPTPAKRETIEKIVDEIEDAHRAVTQDQKLYSILDDAADSIIQPFLKRANSPIGEPLLISNLTKTAKRYGFYFPNMRNLCRHTLKIVQKAKTKIQSKPGLQGPLPDDFLTFS